MLKWKLFICMEIVHLNIINLNKFGDRYKLDAIGIGADDLCTGQNIAHLLIIKGRRDRRCCRR